MDDNHVSLTIDSKHISSKEEVGSLDGTPIHQLTTLGGLVIIAMMKNNEPEILGIGSHRAISRHLAEKRYPKIEWKNG